MSDDTKIGDWYLYQSYAEIRTYGCEFPPYKIPKFVPIQIFSLEFMRKMINMVQLHFLASKKKAHFKIKTQVGPFICNSRLVRQEVEAILKQMNLKHSFTWSYDKSMLPTTILLD